MNGKDWITTVLARNWWLIALRGAAAIVFGLLTFITPGITLALLVTFFGAYALVDGVFTLLSIFRRRAAETPWWTLLLQGLVSIAAGLVTFVWPVMTALVLIYLIGAWAVVTGVLEIAAAIRLRKEIEGEVWLALSGVLSIAFGIFAILAPAVGAIAVVFWIGAYALVFGALLLALAFRLRGRRDDVRERMPRAA
jgi:uncharacterized membrane protein HdeD (DUF308 family)